VVSLSSGLLQLVSSSYLVTSGSAGTSAPLNNGLAQLSSLADAMQSGTKNQASATAISSSSALLAGDTYTPSTQSQAAQSSSTSSKASSPSIAWSVYSSQGSQGETITLASLVKNQTISGASAVRQVLLAAIEPYENGYSAVKEAWDAVGTKVAAGDYSGAQTALTDYTTALGSLHYDMSLIKTPVDALGSALQAGNKDDVQAALTAFTSNTPEGILSVGNLWYSGPGDARDYAAEAAMVVPALTDQLQKVGYTATNAAAEANAIILGIMVDDATIKVNSAPTTDLSSQVDQSIADLAKAIGGQGSTSGSSLSSIIAGMAQANSVAAMESTLTQLDIKYGTIAQNTSADNAS